jgi:hypothetical protein
MASEKVTQLLAELSGGNRDVVDELTPFVYQELKRLAGAQLRRERPGLRSRPQPWFTRRT